MADLESPFALLQIDKQKTASEHGYMEDFQVYYELLGIRPGDGWSKLRSAYKRQIRRWHPDRFTQNGPEKQQAEELSKNINHAYQILAEYYTENGRLPLDKVLHQAQPPEPGITKSTPGDLHASPATDTSPSWVAPTSRNKESRAGLSAGLFVSLMVVVLAGYLYSASDETDSSKQSNESSQVTKPGENDTTLNGKFFGEGSTLGEVHAAQGIPTRMDGDIWYYGNSRVYFHNGRVSHWHAEADQPLRVKDSVVARKDHPEFGVGSTKEEVRSIEGQPLRESDSVWEYGSSLVYFDRHGRVIRWRESPLNPLHVSH